MAVSFYGSWSLVVLTKEAAFEERARITGSNGSDGFIAGVPGDESHVDGEAWQVEMEWSSDGGASWHPSRVRRVPSIVPGKGLVLMLRADDNTEQLGDGDFNDLVLECLYLNEVVNPPGVGAKPYELTTPEDSLWPKRPSPPKETCPGGCCCPCHSDQHRTATGCCR